jgi:excisionase family DNA binding protein
MSKEDNIPDLKNFVSIKDAAKMLGLAYKTVYEYVTEGRIKAARISDVILIPIAEVENFKPNISGRPRSSIPLWRISPEDNTLLQTSISVQIRDGKQALFRQRLEEIRRKKDHLFPGTIARYIVGSRQHPGLVEMTFIWRSSVMPDEKLRHEALQAFQQALADVVDWDTANYDDGPIFMHA